MTIAVCVGSSCHLKGSYDIIVPKFQKLVEGRGTKDYYVRGTFTRENLDFSQDVKDLLIKSSRIVDTIDGRSCVNTLTGITDLRAAPNLLPENAGEVTWLPGYDQEILKGEELVCLVPQDMVHEGTLKLGFVYVTKKEGERVAWETEKTLKVVGTYKGSGSEILYCPYSVVESVYRELKQERQTSAEHANPGLAVKRHGLLLTLHGIFLPGIFFINLVNLRLEHPHFGR